MNIIGCVSMTLGNHEYDWGEEYIRSNLEIADFPFLAINIYNKSTGKRADYCTPSIMVERGGIEIGIIGAMGDCYSSILSDMVKEVEFKVGSELTKLVKAESERLRALGADMIVLSLHDGYDSYDSALSNGYVDLVFEGHTHSAYTKTDAYGVNHLQGGGENSGISHAEIEINSITGKIQVKTA
jgi:2',3'-cyclic-nucleotide 2'-phosphodiesterase (5'-nucleotidase family)